VRLRDGGHTGKGPEVTPIADVVLSTNGTAQAAWRRSSAGMCVRTDA